MASKTELATQYLSFQRDRKLDDLIAMLADDVTMTVPMLGAVSGKSAVEQQIRSRPMGGDVTWSAPEEDGEAVKMVGTGGRFGPVTLQLTFNSDDKVSKIDVALGGGNGQQASATGGGTGFPQGFQPPPLNMEWAKAPTERPPKPTDLGPEGFTLRKADYGSYAWAPDYWPLRNDTPRGAWPAREANRGLPAPYTIYHKHEVWAESSADLYEQAIRERWAPATQVSWGSIEPLAEHVEAALDQIFTTISEQQYNSNQVLMGWLKDISYGYHEVKLYLATQVFEQARHCEAFRKRALSNGGGLGVQTPGFMNRTVYAAFKFTEYVCYVNILRASFLLTLAEWGDRIGRSQADRQLFDGMANDLRRHLTYGVEHVKYYVRHDPSHLDHVHTWLARGEAMYAADLRRDKPYREALILALGDTVQEGKERLKQLRQEQFQKYLRTLEAATVRDREPRILYAFRDVIDNP